MERDGFLAELGAGVAPRSLWSVFALALAVRVTYVVGLYLALGPGALMAADSVGYLGAAQAFLDGGFAALPSDLMPLYALFLAAHFAIQGGLDPLFPVLTQAGLDALACVATALIAGGIDRRLAAPAGAFAALTPSLFVIAGIVYTDSLFLFFATIALLAGLRWLDRPGWRWAGALGMALGLALSTRVMMAPWALAILLALPFGAWACRRLDRWAPAQMLLAAALVAALQAPVLIRNARLYDSLGLTAQGGAHALLWIVPLVRESIDGTPHEAGAAALNREFAQSEAGGETNPFRRSAAMGALARAELAAIGPGPILRAWAIGAAINLGAPALILSPPVSGLPRTGFYETPGANKLAKVWNFLFRNDNPAYAWILLVSLAGLGLARLVQLYGFARLLATDRETRAALLLLAGWVAFILLVNGPIASAKYRLPIEPAMAVFFAAGARAMVERWRGRGLSFRRRA